MRQTTKLFAYLCTIQPLNFTFMDSQYFSTLRELLTRNRSYRRFDSSKMVTECQLTEIVDLTRLCASGRNLQPLKYRIVSTEAECNAIFPALKWAGYYTTWDGPSENERPTAYIVQCLDTQLANGCLCDDGLHLEAITLGATALGLNACIIKSFNSEIVTSSLSIDARYKPIYVVALGYGNEEIKLVDTDGSTDADIRYYHNENGIHTVPKRTLSEIIIK